MYNQIMKQINKVQIKTFKQFMVKSNFVVSSCKKI
jgi:hypothetical protein